MAWFGVDGTGGGGNYFAPETLYLERETIKPEANFYLTDALSDYAAKFLDEHAREHKGQPFFLHLCYTAPHFPLHAKPEDIAKYRGKFRDGWDEERVRRFAKQRQLGIFDAGTVMSPRDPVARAWAEVPEAERDEWDLRMAVHAAMIDCMDQGIGQVLGALRAGGFEENTLVLFLSDNGASAEFLDSWPKPGRGHKPGSETGTRESHRCLEIGWANAANTPFRENKMWTQEGGIATPLIARWPAGISAQGTVANAVSHVIDLMPTFLELAQTSYPKQIGERTLTPLPGRSFVPVLRGGSLGPRALAWEHEGNRAIRVGDWKAVSQFGSAWELYDLSRDRAETRDVASVEPERLRNLVAAWQVWADAVGVVPWEKLPGASYKPTTGYRRKSEPVVP